MRFEGSLLVNRNQIQSLHDATNPTARQGDPLCFQTFLNLPSAVSGLTVKKNALPHFFKLCLRYWHYSFVVIARARNLQPTTHGWNAVFILVSSDYFPFRAIITAACFRMSNCISSSLFRFLSSINSRCSSVRLSTVLKEPVVNPLIEGWGC